MRDPKTFHNQRDNLLETKTLDLQRSGNCEDEEETSETIHCPFCGMTFFAGTTFCGRGAKQTNLSQEQEESAQHPLQERFNYNTARAKLEIRAQNQEAKLYGQSTWLQQVRQGQ